MLNGTSSVLYGTVPELAPNGHVERAFAVFYTCTLGGSALATPLLYGPLGDAVGPHWASLAAAATALAVVPLMLALSHRLHGQTNIRANIMTVLTGRCHCGAVRFDVTSKTASTRSGAALFLLPDARCRRRHGGGGRESRSARAGRR